MEEHSKPLERHTGSLASPLRLFQFVGWVADERQQNVVEIGRRQQTTVPGKDEQGHVVHLNDIPEIPALHIITS